MKKIKVVLYGIGNMGKITTRLLIEKGIEIVGAVDGFSHIGEDLGEAAGLGYPLNIKVHQEGNQVLEEGIADLVVITVGSHMEDMYPIFKECIENRLNIVTIAEDAFYPWRISPNRTVELDSLAKEYGVTLTSGGIQDIFWLNLLTVLSAASHKIESISGQAMNNIDDYGPQGAESALIGATEQEFFDQLNEKEMDISFFGIALEAIAADLDLEIDTPIEWIEPILCIEATKSKALRKTIEKGRVIGQKQVTEISTKQGITLRSEFISKIYSEDEVDMNRWVIEGEPDLYLENPNLPGAEATCAAVINRIPDVINSVPGFITVDKLPKPKYKSQPYETYIN